MIRSYTELRRLGTLEERYRYLALKSAVGDPTFGFDRYLNQNFYTSPEWRQLRHHVIFRDRSCDLGIAGFEIHERIYIHHMNPMTVASIVEHDPKNLDPEYLISVTLTTHNAIHYGSEQGLPQLPVERRPGDTTLWPTKGKS